MADRVHSALSTLTVEEYDGFGDFLKSEGWESLGWGASRHGFKRNKSVIKVPRTHRDWLQGILYGIKDNILEAYSYRKYRNEPDELGIVYAPCRLLSNYCLMMPYVERVYNNDIPNWAWHLDGQQVGTFKDRVVAYDSSYDIRDELHEALSWLKETFPLANISEIVNDNDY